MMPNTVHIAITLSLVTSFGYTPAAIFTGSHFYCYSTMAKSILGQVCNKLWHFNVTNSEHNNAESALHQMGILAFYQHHQAASQQTLQALQTNHWQQGFLSKHNTLNICCLLFMLLTPEWFQCTKNPSHNPLFL